MDLRWMSLPGLALLLAAVLLCGGAVSGDGSEAADQGGWVPIVAPLTSPSQTPRFGSRIIKPRLPRQEVTATTTAAASTKAPKTPTPRPVTSTKAPTPRPLSSKAPKPTKATSPSPARPRPSRQEPASSTPASDDDEETKSLAQQVQEGKYGLIQNELFATPPSRPGVISYVPNPEVPRDTEDNLGGLRPDEIWLSEGHVLVLSGGPLGAEGHWQPIDNYQAPPRQVKLPPNPSVPPPFPVQLQDGGPTGFVTSNGSNPFLFRAAPGNFEPGNGIYPQLPPPPPFPRHNGSPIPPPPQGLYRQENLTQDDDDPSIFYPPPYDFSYHHDNSTEVPPGPLVPGIVLPPPPSFFAPLNHSAKPALFIPDDIHNHVDPYELERHPPEHYSTVIPPTAPTENEIAMPEYPVKEPNVFLHHHGSPVYITKNITPTRVHVSPPEKLIVYELPTVSLPKERGPGRTVVSSTPSPTALYYTLPTQAPVKLTIYTATPAPQVKQHHTQSIFYTTPKPQSFTTKKYYDPPSSTPQPIFLYPDTTPAPKYRTTTPPPVYTTPKIKTTSPKYLTSFQPSPYDFATTTPAPIYNYNPAPKGRYLPNIQDGYYYDAPQAYQPPRYLPPRPAPRPSDGYYYPPPQQQQYYDPRPDPGYYYQPQRRPVVPTPAPAYNDYYYQPPQRRPQSEVGFYYPTPQRNQAVVSTTPNPVFTGLYTPQDEKYMDEITKGYFTLFGQKLTTPLPPLKSNPVSLHDDTRVNYRRPLPPINPDSEFIEVRSGGGRDPSVVSYQLPGEGQRGPSHYYFLTPRLAHSQGARVPREGARTPRENARVADTPKSNIVRSPRHSNNKPSQLSKKK